MFDKLSERDKRTLKLGAAGVVLILAYAFVIDPWVNDWLATRSALKVERAKLDSIAPGNSGMAARQAGLASIVPKFKMPQSENVQGPLFRGKFNEQLKKAGVNVSSLQFLRTAKSKQTSGYKTLRIQGRGKCKFEQLLNLLVGLNDNPCLVGVEELQLKCDTKNREQMDIVLTVSTFVK
ncbi:MAG: GspMb/PilO family protein [Planctomycetota bacterium]|jgi:hypothetical protein